MRVNQKISRREVQKGYKSKVRFKTHNGIPERGLVKCSMVYSFIKKGKKSIGKYMVLWLTVFACFR